MKAEEEAARLMSEMDLARRRAAEVTTPPQHTQAAASLFVSTSPPLGLAQLYWCALFSSIESTGVAPADVTPFFAQKRKVDAAAVAAKAQRRKEQAEAERLAALERRRLLEAAKRGVRALQPTALTYIVVSYVFPEDVVRVSYVSGSKQWVAWEMPFVSILARKSSDSIYALYRTEDLHYLIGVDVKQWQKLLDERAAALASDRAWDLDLMPNAHPPMMPQPMISTRPNSATEPVWGAPDSGSGAEAQAGGTRRRVQSARSAQSARSRPKSRVVVGAGATVGSVDGATILAMYADMMSSSKEREEAAAEAQAQEKAADTVAAEVVKGMVDGGGVVPWGETDESLRATPSYGAAGKAGGRDSAQHAADARRGSQTARPATAPASPRRQPSTVQMGLVPASAALPPQGGSSARGALEEASGRHNTAAGTAKRPRSTGVKYFAASGTGRLSGEGYDAGFMDAIRQVAVSRSPPRHPSPPRRSPPRNGYGGTRTTLLRPAGSAPPRSHRSLRMQQRQGRNPETDAESGSSAAPAQPKGPMMWISPRGQDGKVYGGSTADQQRPRTASLAYSQPRDAFPQPGRQERPQTAGVRPASFPAARSPTLTH